MCCYLGERRGHALWLQLPQAETHRFHHLAFLIFQLAGDERPKRGGWGFNPPGELCGSPPYDGRGVGEAMLEVREACDPYANQRAEPGGPHARVGIGEGNLGGLLVSGVTRRRRRARPSRGRDPLGAV